MSSDPFKTRTSSAYIMIIVVLRLHLTRFILWRKRHRQAGRSLAEVKESDGLAERRRAACQSTELGQECQIPSCLARSGFSTSSKSVFLEVSLLSLSHCRFISFASSVSGGISFLAEAASRLSSLDSVGACRSSVIDPLMPGGALSMIPHPRASLPSQMSPVALLVAPGPSKAPLLSL